MTQNEINNNQPIQNCEHRAMNKHESTQNSSQTEASKASNTYLDVTYGSKAFTNYPDLLAKYLTEKYLIKKNSRFLDLGCGRGEFLRGFIKQGMEGFGIDQADTAKEICPMATIKVGNLENKLPFEDNYFDVVFSKSVVEHFYYPEKILSEIHRVLKPNGLVITMTPDWAHNVICFHDDFTHRTAFTLRSLNDIHNVSHFRNVITKRFIQLPLVWQIPSLKFLTALCRKLAPDSLKKHSKFVRFSKEIMLITTANK
jgi:ubiquinone/menaquinone biosynthesis C-methylase UbiE